MHRFLLRLLQSVLHVHLRVGQGSLHFERVRLRLQKNLHLFRAVHEAAQNAILNVQLQASEEALRKRQAFAAFRTGLRERVPQQAALQARLRQCSKPARFCFRRGIL